MSLNVTNYEYKPWRVLQHGKSWKWPASACLVCPQETGLDKLFSDEKHKEINNIAQFHIQGIHQRSDLLNQYTFLNQSENQVQNDTCNPSSQVLTRAHVIMIVSVSFKMNCTFLKSIMFGEKTKARLWAVILLLALLATRLRSPNNCCRSILFWGGTKRNRSCNASISLASDSSLGISKSKN